MVGLDKTLTFRGGLLGKRGVTFFRGGAGGGGGYNFQAAITKKTRNSNWKIVPKNLVTFER